MLTFLVVGGMFIFASGAFGLLARGETHITSVAFNHIVLGLGAGFVLLVSMLALDYRRLREWAPYMYGAALVASALVFIPHIGLSHGGGTRWLLVGPLSFQPGELLKIGGVIAAAAYFSAYQGKIGDWQYGIGGLVGLLVLPAAILLKQPDIGTLGVVVVGIVSVFFAAGARWRDIIIMVLAGALLVGTMAYLRPYVRDRITTFLHPADNPQAEGWQVRQALIAIGSGGLTGRGFGQGIQKFTYLPEPMGDSIFAVAGEELGFIGGVVIVLLFLAFGVRGFAVAAHAPDLFGALLATGIATYLTIEAFINIGAMLGVLPLTGIPLTFISQGGSAILISLLSAGILLNISRR
jgi:cell division protein FtsW